MTSAAQAITPTITLNNGVEIPQLGYGVFQIPAQDTQAAVESAFEVGYRHIDTAAAYGNEEGVGNAVAAAGLPRDEVFVTTKLNNPSQGYDSTLTAFDDSMDKLGLDVLDLYLIHWPWPQRDDYVDSWKAFLSLYADGRIRSVGVSNFLPEHLERLAAETDVVPAVNQVELHPWLPQKELRTYHAEHGIATEAWSPLAQGGEFLSDATLAAVAAKHDRSVAQVVLRWHLQVGNIVIPKSVTRSRVEENFGVLGYELDADDMATIDTLDNGTRTGGDPATFPG